MASLPAIAKHAGSECDTPPHLIKVLSIDAVQGKKSVVAYESSRPELISSLGFAIPTAE